MSRDVVPEAVLAGAAAVLLALVVAVVSRGARSGRGAVVTSLVYPLLVAPGATAAGVTLPVLLGLAVVSCLPLVAARAAAARHVDAPGGGTARVAALARAAVAAGLVVVVLAAAGQTVALLGRVDARTTVVLIGASGAGVALVGGLVGTSRVGVWAALLLLPTVAIVLAAGVALGSPGDLLDPAVTVAGPSATQWLAWALALAALGWADPALNRAVGRATGAQVLRIGVLLLAVVLAGGLGLLMLLGGAVVGPSMQLFVLPANIGVIPGAVLVVLLGVVLAAVAMVAALLAAAGSGIGPAGPEPWPAPAPVLVLAAVGVVGATVTTSVESAAVVAALVAPAVAGSEAAGWGRRPARQPDRQGLVAGTGAALVAAVALAVSGQLAFGGAAVVALSVVAAVAAAAQARSGRRRLVTAGPADQR